MAISKRLRFAILKRDDFTCAYCGAAPGHGVTLHVDHCTPRSKGGTDDLWNLVTSCSDCNLGKAVLETPAVCERCGFPGEPMCGACTWDLGLGLEGRIGSYTPEDKHRIESFKFLWHRVGLDVREAADLVFSGWRCTAKDVRVEDPQRDPVRDRPRMGDRLPVHL